MTRLQAVDAARIVAMHPITQGLPVHAVLLGRFGARTALQHQRDRKNAANLRAIVALAGETPKFRRCSVQTCDRDRRAHSMPPGARIAAGRSSRRIEGFGTPQESLCQRGLVLVAASRTHRPAEPNAETFGCSPDFASNSADAMTPIAA